jgi:hypothetical protein
MRKTPILIATCLSLLASAAVAAPREEARLANFAKRMFAAKSFDKKTVACFARVYDAAHLAHHPKQTVSGMTMLISAEKLQDDDGLSYAYRLGLNFRNRTGDYASDMDCGHARASETKRGSVNIGCSDGCEGGGIEIALAPDAKAVIVKVDSIAVWPAANPEDQDAQFEFKGGGDDRVFRLERVDTEMCRSLTKDGNAVAALPTE